MGLKKKMYSELTVHDMKGDIWEFKRMVIPNGNDGGWLVYKKGPITYYKNGVEIARKEYEEGIERLKCIQ